jgi:hypothetical protein
MSTSPDQTLLAGRYRFASAWLGRDGRRLPRRGRAPRARGGASSCSTRRAPRRPPAAFEREAKLGASLNHPNLVGVYDIVTTAEDVLIVMEYVEVRRWLASLPTAPCRARGRSRSSAASPPPLTTPHGPGVVHRDVKPANVLGADGVARLADLGSRTAAERHVPDPLGHCDGDAVLHGPRKLSDGALGPRSTCTRSPRWLSETLAGRKARSARRRWPIAHEVASDPPPPDLREAWPDAPSRACGGLQARHGPPVRTRRPPSAALVAELPRRWASAPRAVTTRPSDPTKRLSRPSGERTGRGDRDGDGRRRVAAGGGARWWRTPRPRSQQKAKQATTRAPRPAVVRARRAPAAAPPVRDVGTGPSRSR